MNSILYIDDEMPNLRNFSAFFRREYHILTASTAEEALDILEKNPVQLVITDQRMPEITGVQLLKIIKNKYPDLLTIILTGFSDITTIMEAVNECGIFRYFTKPWKESEMRLAIQKALDAYKLQEENRLLLQKLANFNQQLELEVSQKNQIIAQLQARILELEQKTQA